MRVVTVSMRRDRRSGRERGRGQENNDGFIRLKSLFFELLWSAPSDFIED